MTSQCVVQLAKLLQFMGEHVQQHFRVGVRVDVAQIGPEQVLAEIISIGQVAVVSQADPIR